MLHTLLSFVAVLPHRLRLWSGGARPAVRSGITLPCIAIVAPAFFFLYGLGRFALRDNNEGLYAEIAREMLAGGDWIVPHLNGVPYIEKPPLLYWIEAMAMAVFGVTPGAARLASGVSMFLLSLGLLAFGRRHASLRAGCLASIVLATMVPLALGAHLVLFDPLLCALLGGSMLCFLHGALAGADRAHRAHCAGACLLGLAVLEKGAVALVLALGAWGLFVLLARMGAAPPRLPSRVSSRLSRSARRTLLVALALFLVLVLPWHLLAAWRQPGFAWFYVVNEHVLRFLGRRQPDDYHHGPWWFYVPRLLQMVAPWTPFLAMLPWRAPPGTRAVLLRFCQAGTLFPLLFFSLSQAKADYYLMVCAPFLALWLGLALDAAVDAGGTRVRWCWAAAVACCLVLLVALPGYEGRQWSPLLVALLLLAWLCLLVPGARCFAALKSPAAREGAVLALAMFCAPLLAWSVRYAGEREADDSSRHVAQLIRAVPGSPPAVFLYRDFEDRWSTLPFYLGRPVPLIDSVSRDLAFGCAFRAGRQCIGRDAFLRQLGNGPVAVAVYAPRRAEFLALAGPGWRSIEVGNRIVFFHDGNSAGPPR